MSGRAVEPAETVECKNNYETLYTDHYIYRQTKKRNSRSGVLAEPARSGVVVARRVLLAAAGPVNADDAALL